MSFEVLCMIQIQYTNFVPIEIMPPH